MEQVTFEFGNTPRDEGDMACDASTPHAATDMAAVPQELLNFADFQNTSLSPEGTNVGDVFAEDISLAAMQNATSLLSASSDWQQFDMLHHQQNDGYTSAGGPYSSAHPGSENIPTTYDWPEYIMEDVATEKQKPIDQSCQLGPSWQAKSRRESMLARPQRRQNRACDQCRLSKKACDLPSCATLSTDKRRIACSTCRVKKVDCTVTWLAKKQKFGQKSKASRLAASLSPQSPPKTPFETLYSDTLVEAESSPSGTALRLFLGREMCAQKFQLYVEATDMPLSQCLWYGSMPPRYSFGVTAYTQLANSDSITLSACLQKAKEWIGSCWATRSGTWATLASAPHLLRTTSVLDSVFEYKVSSRASAMRDTSITETYKWVAVATGAQFTTDAADRSDAFESNVRNESSYDRDISYAAWDKARKMLFGNIASTTSFRLAMALVLFGLITPPKQDGEVELPMLDTEYAFCEGLQRLQKLCSLARDRLEAEESVSIGGQHQEFDSVRTLPADIKINILELVAAVEWLTTLANNFVASTTLGKVCAIDPDSVNIGAADLHGMDRTAADKDSVALWDSRPSQQDIKESVVIRAKTESQAFATLWSNGVSDERLFYAARNTASVSILLSQTLARFTIAVEKLRYRDVDFEAILHHFDTTMELVELWREIFGTLASTSTSRLQQPFSGHWRMIAMCSGDTELCILLFYDIAQKLERRLSKLHVAEKSAMATVLTALQATKSHRNQQRVISAFEILVVASTCLPNSSQPRPCDASETSRLRLIGTHPVSFSWAYDS